MPRIYKVVEAVKEEFADAVANGGGIYAVGYCFGGKYVLLLGGEESSQTASSRKLEDEEQGKAGKDPVIKAGAIAHGGSLQLIFYAAYHFVTPSLDTCEQVAKLFELTSISGTQVTLDDINALRTPVSMVCVGKSMTLLDTTGGRQ